MKFSFHPEAEEEFFAAIDYYEDCKIGLGYDFSIEIYSSIDRIKSFPKAWTLLEKDIHRCLINRFPYGIIYTIDDNEIIILAIMHLHREPDYWKHRFKKR